MHDVVGWRCAVCGTDVDLLAPDPWRCPRSTLHDRHHVLHAVVSPLASTPDRATLDEGVATHANPFVRHDHRSAWAAAAAARGMTQAARFALVAEVDAAVRAVDGAGFESTPFARSDVLSLELGFSDGGGVWVKDETGAVGGSQKARHLASILFHLRALELAGELRERPPLAIASCGNAALAAATLARSVEWPLDVYVPTWMSDGFGDRLDRLGANVHRCERRATDPPGDPAMLRFREAVAEGAVPFTVQGPENALCLDGGRTIGWEIAEQSARLAGELDGVFVQVGGGAFAACLGRGLLDLGRPARIEAVQAEGCAPLARAWGAGADRTSDWASVMTPWEDPTSIADGILDDETYDWIGVLDVVRSTDGAVVVAPEEQVVRAHELATSAGFDVSATGSAGLAGLIARLETSDDDGLRQQRVAVVMSGIRR